jgi:hypothetical protein
LGTISETPLNIKNYCMKNILLLFVVVASAVAATAQGTFRIGNGAYLKLAGGAYVVTDDMNVENNGDITMPAGDGTIKFTGSTNVSLLGSGNTTLSTLYMLKNTSSQLNLQQNIVVNQQVFFSLGNINLGNNTITLQGIGAVNGESDLARIMGTGSGYVQIISSLNAPASANPGNLGAIITSASDLGNTTVRRGHTSQVNSFGNGNSILRYYDIIPTNNSSLNATLRFSYLDAELNGLNENSLTLWRSANNSNWTNLGFDTRNPAVNYVEKTGIDQLFRFTLADVSSPLPVHFTAVNVQCLTNAVKVTWTTAAEQGSKNFVIEQSNNGYDWTKAGTISAGGTTSGTRSYSYTVAGTGNSKYRLVEEAIDGRRTYSPVVLSNCSATALFSVYPNPVTDHLLVSLTTNEDHPVSIKVFDASGRQIGMRSQNVVAGNNSFIIDARLWPSGMYFIKVEDKGMTYTASVVK